MLTIFIWLKNNKNIAALCAYVWAAIIFGACLIPGRDVPSFTIFRFDKVLHFGIFGLLAFLLLFRFQKPKILNQGLVIWLVCSAYGYLIEVLQGSGITEGRSFDNYDALADSMGAVLGVFCFFIFNYLLTKRKAKL